MSHSESPESQFEYISKHHLWFEKWKYKTPEDKLFRQFGAFVIKGVPLEIHKELHAQVEPPPKPYPKEMIGCLATAQNCIKSHDNPLWGAESAMQYFVWRGATYPETEPHCRDIRWNLAKQIGILAQAYPLGDLGGS